MSEKNQIIEVEVVPNDALIDIKVSGAFMSRIMELAMNFFPFKSEEHMRECLKHVKEKTNSEDPYVYHLTTLLALVNDIEEEAKKQNKTKKVKLDKKEGNIIQD